MCGLAARGESPAAFDRRCIPLRIVVHQSNTAGIFPLLALLSGRIADLGATRGFTTDCRAAETGASRNGEAERV